MRPALSDPLGTALAWVWALGTAAGLAMISTLAQGDTRLIRTSWHTPRSTSTTQVRTTPPDRTTTVPPCPPCSAPPCEGKLMISQLSSDTQPLPVWSRSAVPTTPARPNRSESSPAAWAPQPPQQVPLTTTTGAGRPSRPTAWPAGRWRTRQAEEVADVLAHSYLERSWHPHSAPVRFLDRGIPMLEASVAATVAVRENLDAWRAADRARSLLAPYESDLRAAERRRTCPLAPAL